jgi:hypothetical protein
MNCDKILPFGTPADESKWHHYVRCSPLDCDHHWYGDFINPFFQSYEYKGDNCAQVELVAPVEFYYPLRLKTKLGTISPQ